MPSSPAGPPLLRSTGAPFLQFLSTGPLSEPSASGYYKIMQLITAVTSLAIAIQPCGAFAPSAPARFAQSKTSLRMADDGEVVMNKYSR